MRDKRAYEIKRILKKAYPEATFRVKIDKYSMGESINVYTSLIDDIRGMTEKEKIDYKINNNSEPYNDLLTCLRKELKGYENIFRDEITGEILSGGNTYLFFGGIETY